MLLNIYNKNLKYIFLFSSLIFGLFLESTPEYIDYLFILFVILNVIFFSKSVVIYFNNLFKKKINIEKLMLFIVVLSFISIFINFQEENNFSLNQIFRDYIFLSYIFIPYLFLKLDLSFKEISFITFSVVLMGYIILARVIFNNYFTFFNHTFFLQDLSYIHTDVSILFSLNFLSIFFFYKKKYFLFFLFFLQYIYFVYFMEHSGSILPKISLIFISLVLVLNLIGKYYKIFEIKFSSNFFVAIIFLLTLLIFLNILKIDILLNNRQFEFEYFKNFFLDTSLLNVFFGQGLGNKFVIYYLTEQKISFLHNFILYMILKFGFFGFIFLSIYFLTITKIYKLNFNLIIKAFEFSNRSLPIISFILLLLLGLVFTTFYKTYSYWILFSIVIMNLNLEKNEKLS